MGNWPFTFNLVRREMRAGFIGFRVFLACLILGVAVIAFVGSIGSSFTAGLDANARVLLGGDVDLRFLQRDFSEKQLNWLRNHSQGLSKTVEMRAMVRPINNRDKRSLVEMKAVDKAYPLVGTLQSSSNQPLVRLLEERENVWGAVVDTNLLGRLGLKKNDLVKVGATQFEIRGTVISEPDRAASFLSFGPRFLVAFEALKDTELVKPGSQIRYHTRVVLETNANHADWRSRIEAAFPSAGWRIRGLVDAAPGAQRFIDRMALFLSFVSLTILLISGLGMATTVNSYLNTKTNTIAILKCVGGSGPLIFRVFMSQVMFITAFGVATGLVIGACGAYCLLILTKHLIPVAPIPGFYPEPLTIAGTFGFFVAMAFSIWSIARSREIPPAALFRDAVAPNTAQPRPIYKVATAISIIILAAYTILISQDRLFATWFVIGATATILILLTTARIVAHLAHRLTNIRNPTIRLALSNLYRPGNGMKSIILALGSGLAMLVAVGLIQGNLSQHMTDRLPEKAPAFFFLDIQPHQVLSFDQTINDAAGVKNYQRFPTLRGRITKIDGAPVSEREIAVSAEWAVRGDRVLTYLKEKPSAAKIVAGQWWSPLYRGPPAISLDASLARGFGVKIGDTLTLNILGREVTATILSLREIDWRSLRFDFAIIFAPGTLEGAPHSHIAAVGVHPNSEDALEKAATDPFPNISSIRVREALAAAINQLSGIGIAASAMAAITILSGALVLVASVTANRRRQQYEAILYKVLGAKRLDLFKVFLLEYGLIGAITGLIGSLLGSVIAWAVVTKLMKMSWIFLPQTVASIIIICIFSTLALGFMGTWRVLGKESGKYLRNR